MALKERGKEKKEKEITKKREKERKRMKKTVWIKKKE